MTLPKKEKLKGIRKYRGRYFFNYTKPFTVFDNVGIKRSNLLSDDFSFFNVSSSSYRFIKPSN
jgi:hypothetical protein